MGGRCPFSPRENPSPPTFPTPRLEAKSHDERLSPPTLPARLCPAPPSAHLVMLLLAQLVLRLLEGDGAAWKQGMARPAARLYHSVMASRFNGSTAALGSSNDPWQPRQGSSGSWLVSRPPHLALPRRTSTRSCPAPYSNLQAPHPRRLTSAALSRRICRTRCDECEKLARGARRGCAGAGGVGAGIALCSWHRCGRPSQLSSSRAVHHRCSGPSGATCCRGGAAEDLPPTPSTSINRPHQPTHPVQQALGRRGKGETLAGAAGGGGGGGVAGQAHLRRQGRGGGQGLGVAGWRLGWGVGAGSSLSTPAP